METAFCVVFFANGGIPHAIVNFCTLHLQGLDACTSVMTSARSRVNMGNDVSQLLLIVSDGRGIFLEGIEVGF
jgi:hypothetical protein